jgi:GNAT superfamily N-acetyltransferase
MEKLKILGWEINRPIIHKSAPKSGFSRRDAHTFVRNLKTGKGCYIFWSTESNPEYKAKPRDNLPFGQPLLDAPIRTKKGEVTIRRLDPETDSGREITRLRNLSRNTIVGLYYPPIWLTHDRTDISEFQQGRNDIVIAEITVKMKFLWKITRKRKIVGCAAFRENPSLGNETAEFTKLMVHPNYRRLGIGTALVKVREKLAADKEHGFTRAWMDTSTKQMDSLNIHVANGWKIIGYADNNWSLTNDSKIVFLDKEL